MAVPTPKAVPFEQGMQAVLLRPIEYVLAAHGEQRKLVDCEQSDEM